MTTRENVGSWLEGGPGGDQGARGARLGLPAQGPGSAAGVGRRIVALVVDWTVCLAISATFFPADETATFLVRADSIVTLAVFALENLLLVGLLGFTLGHRLLGLRVRTAGYAPGGTPVSDDARAPGLVRGFVRTALLCLVIPAVVWDADGRGLHDRLAGTAIVRR
ncbi:RDD family protein [Cellulomonas sp. DKR-3]|uniref:RDD family protein n=1 Tax=Cellulomonas fulva TaxID=2835530 RepID=A0ABS5U093_9CELL|nr:RDD family protein [Cellulomonas fulva]MBT0994828.1 RDD family protein [Cellulomonas fulva]